FAVVREVRAVAADRCGDRLARLGMRSDLPRQRQQPLRDLGRDILQRHVLRDRRALLAALDVGPETAAPEQNAVAKLGWPLALRLVAALPKLLGVAALRIIGAGDEGTELAAAQA